ncbi:MAG: MarR family winged helix-turn-helix transcriptional regulator [Bacillota bacterium]
MFKHAKELVAEAELVLREVSSIIKRRGRDILIDYPVTPPQFSALLALRRLKNPTMTQLCEFLSLASSTVTDLVDRMERNELVERIRDVEDRRIIRLKITKQGLKVVDAVVEQRRNYLAEVFEDIDSETLQELLRLLTLLRGKMQEHEDRSKENEADN